MGALFISYRRGETDGQARALKNELAAILGRDRVFMDVDNITLGRDFRHALQERLTSCDLMLALIGRDWVSAKDKSGRRRLEDPADFVRMEISSALKRSIPITPVLLQGASMPTAEQLPGDLKELAFRNGFELSHNHWESDVREMIRRLGFSADMRRLSFSADARRSSPATTPARVAGVRPAPSPAAPRKTLLWSAIAIGAIVVAAGGLLVHDKFSQEAAEEAHRAQIALEQAKADRARAEAEAERVRVMAAADRARAAAEAEKAKAAAEKAAADRAAADRAAADRAAADRAAAERAAANRAKAAADRAAAEKAAADRAAAEKAAADRAAAEKAAADRAAAEKAAQGVPNFAGTWANLTVPQEGPITITQNGRSVRFEGDTYTIRSDGKLFKRVLLADDGNDKLHRVATEAEADVVVTRTWYFDGPILVLDFSMWDIKRLFPRRERVILRYKRI